MERALVTGATGFLGGHLVRTLVDRGVTVHALVRPGPKVANLAEQSLTIHEVTGRAGDMSGDVEIAVERARPDVCFHLATHFVAQHASDDVAALAEANIELPMRVADALARIGPARFVNTGTGWQHVGGAEYRPNSLYSATKQAFDDVLAYYSWAGQLEVVTLRIFDSYGPDDPRGKVLSALLRATAGGEPLEMSSGRALIDLVHVDDIVEALILAASTPVAPGAPTRYSLSSGAPLRVRELVDLVSEVTGREVPVQWGARPDRPDEMREPWDAGPPLPGWKPRVGLRDGIAALAR